MSAAGRLAGALAERALWLPEPGEPLLSMVGAGVGSAGPGKFPDARVIPGAEGRLGPACLPGNPRTRGVLFVPKSPPEGESPCKKCCHVLEETGIMTNVSY